MENKITEEMPSITLQSVRRFVKALADQPDDFDLSLEFVLTAFFPDVWTRITKYTNDCYMQGFMDGRKEAVNANQGN